MKAIILAAGIGSRLGNPDPKCLSQLPDGETILSRQLSALRRNNVTDITIIVGYKKELIMTAVDNVHFIENADYDSTNTSKSLLKGLDKMKDDVIWMNGDVIFDDEVIKRVVQENGNIVAVNKAKCGEEEIKYTVADDGYINEISKTVIDALGEAVGVNKISKDALAAFQKSLDKCQDNDYFEKAIELAAHDNIKFKPIDISDLKCMEIDFKTDFDQAVKLFFNTDPKKGGDV